MNIRHITAGSALLVALLLIHPAAAQVTLSPTPVTLTGTPGETLTFSGTLTNMGTSPVFLNGDALTFNAPNITADDSVFNPPPFLTAGNPVALPTNQYSGPFFTVTISTAAQPGDYNGAFVVEGGADGSASDPLATQQFTVRVSDATTAPEPSSAATFIVPSLGLAALTLRARRRRAHT